MASPHQGSLAHNRSAFNFTQEGLIVGAHEPSLAMLDDEMESYPKVLEGLHIQVCSPRAYNSHHLSHNHSKKHVLYLGVCTYVVSTHACIRTQTNICVEGSLGD